MFPSASETDGRSETIIHCSTSNTFVTNLTWRFNQSEIILRKSGSDTRHVVSERWKQHVKAVSEAGSLSLQDLSSEQEGTYTCELREAEETIITNIHVRIRGGKPASGLGFLVNEVFRPPQSRFINLR